MSDPKEAFNAAIVAASEHLRSGRAAEAEAAYRDALAAAPNHPVVLHNLGVLIAKRGDHDGAIAAFDQALAVEPTYPSALFNRGVALLKSGRRREAIASLVAVTEVEPAHYEAHRVLGFCWLAEGERGRSLDHFGWTYELRRGEQRGGIARVSLTHANRTKLAHDRDQFDYLSHQKARPNNFEQLTRIYALAARDFPEAVTELTDADFELIGENYNTAINIAFTPEVRGNAVAPRPDAAELSQAFGEGGLGVVYFDGLLTPEALADLRRYLLESTVWHDFSHIDGHVASYLEDGLACPLILQIADEIRAAFPDLLKDHPLSQAWAFKGVTPDALIDVHSDDAALSVNFWVTPSEANLDPAGSGMKVCVVPPPSDWTVESYDSDKARAVQFLEQNREQVLTIPYAGNRAVLFRSRLLHVSDQPKFREAYENNRINVTMLFGTADPATSHV